MTSLLNVMIHKDVEQLLTNPLLDDLSDAERAFSREKTVAIIHAALWAYSARSGSTASAYAINSLFEAIGLSTWTFKPRPTQETPAVRTFVAAGPEQGMSTMCECGQTFAKHIAQDHAGNACVCPTANR